MNFCTSFRKGIAINHKINFTGNILSLIGSYQRFGLSLKLLTERSLFSEHLFPELNSTDAGIEQSRKTEQTLEMLLRVEKTCYTRYGLSGKFQ